MALKVLMVGGRRCGKTTALAVIFDQIINGPVNNYFTVSDKTTYITKGFESQDVLDTKQLELERLLEKPTTDIFLVDSGPTYFDWTYNLELKVPGTHRTMNVEFVDVPGEWFEPGAGATDSGDGTTKRDKITKLIAESDVFVIMVDTPYLMASDSVAKATNCVGGIRDYLTNISADSDKLVIFSPIKCEKWVRENRMNEVVDRLRKVYGTTIAALSAYPKMSVAIIPIETAGNILFFEHSDPTILAEIPPKKCMKVSERFLRMSDGKTRMLRPSDTLNPDPMSVSCGIMRPYSWFEVNKTPTTPILYAPNNCEQIAVHILQFQLAKMLANTSGFWDSIFWKLKFGAISRDEMTSKLSAMRSTGIIKNGVDNIEYVKNHFKN